MGGSVKNYLLHRRGAMPEPDYNLGEPPGFFPWFVALTIVIALALWYAACS